MGCISCKTVDPTEGKNLAGKARLPGIPRKEKKKILLKRKKILGEINAVDINKEKAKILQQLEEKNIIAKKSSGGVAYVFGDDDEENQAKPKNPPQRIMERSERPSTSHGFNSEEKEIMAECLKKESLQEKGRLAKISEERRFIAEMNREKALKIKALELEWKLKQREKKQEELKKRKEQESIDVSCRNYEKQQKAKCRRFVIERSMEQNAKNKTDEKENGTDCRLDMTSKADEKENGKDCRLDTTSKTEKKETGMDNKSVTTNKSSVKGNGTDYRSDSGMPEVAV